jgi:hypothetical protein
MMAILRACLSLDGKLLTASGKPSRRGIAMSRLKAAKELRLRILPVIIGGKETPTLSGVPGPFLPDDLDWELISSGESGAGVGELVLRYRRIPLKGKRA